MNLRTGITTGACAAAAAKAAILTWLGEKPAFVEINAPAGKLLTVPVSSAEAFCDGGRAVVFKDAGDDPDITNGVAIIVEVLIREGQPEIVFSAGEGIGKVTLPGLQIPVGEPAINPVPRQMIETELRSLLPSGSGALVSISIPDGEHLAKRTLNPTLGIVGGLSIIGTTGIVEPMSEEAFKNSLKPQISVAKALGYNSIVMVPGKIGQDFAVGRYLLPAASVLQTSNFIGFMLESAVEYGIEEVLLFGHLGKLVKVAGGIFHTHNRMADARMETLAAYMAAEGAPQEAVKAVLGCMTTEAAIPILQEYELNSVYSILAQRASVRARRYVFGDLRVGTAIVTMKGELLGLDDEARRIGGRLGWTIV
ncbi:MAG: cobalt-precorrin-5B (C(1))-methyltransferase CbiD [Negativicutes bacterium]